MEDKQEMIEEVKKAEEAPAKVGDEDMVLADSDVSESVIAAEDAAEATSAVPEEADKPEDAGKAGDAAKSEDDGKYDVEGILELSDDGFGFLRFDNFLTSNKDIIVRSQLP